MLEWRLQMNGWLVREHEGVVEECYEPPKYILFQSASIGWMRHKLVCNNSFPPQKGSVKGIEM